MAEAADDTTLIRRLKARDPNAMAELYDRYGARVYALARRMVRHPGMADDLVQESFLRLWVRAHQLEDGCVNLGPWLLTVARNQALDYLRSSATKQEQSKAEPIEPPQPARQEQDAIATSSAKRLREAFAGLTGEQQRVIELAYYEGLSQSEMAERLQKPLGTVKTWVRSALQQLRLSMGATV